MKSALIVSFLSILPFVCAAQDWYSKYTKADSFSVKKNYKAALLLFEQALPLAEKEFGKPSENYLKTRNGLGRCRVQWPTDEVEKFLQETEVVCAKQSKLSEVYVISLINLGLFYKGKSNYDSAETIFKRALEFGKLSVGEKHPTYAKALRLLGLVYFQSEKDYSLAETFMKKALVIHKETLMGKHIDYSDVINNLAVLYDQLGRYREAEPHYLLNLQLNKERLGENSTLYAYSLANMGGFYIAMGDYENAGKCYTSSLAILKKNLGDQHQDYIQVLYSYGRLKYLLNEYPESEALFKKAERSLRETKSGLRSTILNALSAINSHKGFYAQADSLSLKALSLVPAQSFESSFIYNQLGFIKKSQKQFDQAFKYYRISKEIIAKTKTNASQEYRQNINSYALTYWNNKQYELAASAFREQKAIMLTSIEKEFRVKSEREKELFYENKVRQFIKEFISFVSYIKSNKIQLQTAITQKDETLVGELFNLQLFTKALLLNASAKWKKNILGSGDKKLIAKFLEWETLRNKLTSLYQKDNTINLIDSLEAKANGLEKELIKLSERFSRLVNNSVPKWQDVQARLKPNEAAIEIVRLSKFGVTKTVTDSSAKGLPKYDVKYLTDTIQYAVLIITKNSIEPNFILMKNGLEMERQLKAYRNAMKLQLEDKYSYDILWRPIAHYLESQKIKKVYLSPDGLYYQVNLNTLYNQQSKRYLLDETKIQQLTNTKDILIDNQEETANHYAFLIGNPSFDSSTVELPSTKIEVEKIEEELTTSNWEAEVKQGKDAQEQVLKDLMKPKLLHIATHGYFEPLYEETNEEKGIIKEPKTTLKANPLWRSGLLFYKPENKDRLDEATTSEESDGILTAYEAMNLNLEGTELVVLSACETGLGDIKYGEGVYGLQRAFKIAGAKNIIMSLWKVDDQVTQELMVEFYANWLKEQNVHQAFQLVQQKLKIKYKNPYYWGAFILIGE